jgi:hypothetical protein
MTLQQKIDRAAELGEQAFREGRKAVPAHDPNLMPLFKDVKPGEAIEILDAWISAWHHMNVRVKDAEMFIEAAHS